MSAKKVDVKVVAKSGLEYDTVLKDGKAKAGQLFSDLSGALAWDEATREIVFAAPAEAEDYFGALDKFRQAINIKPKKAEAYFLAGVVCARVHEDALALEYLDRAITLGAKNAEAYLVRGAVKNILCDYEGARADLKTAAARGNPAAKKIVAELESQP